jgi:two-component system CheB/CheR fusion protein
LIEQATEHAVLLMNPSGEIMWCNPGAERVFGLSLHEFIGRPSREIFTDRDRAAGLDGLELAIAGADAIAEDDRWHLRADGSRFWSSGVLIQLKDKASGQVLGFGKILRDRTDLKTQIELIKNQLQHTREIEREKDRAITKLSHELRNVIAGLRGAVELLDQPLDDATRRNRFAGLMRDQLAVIAQLTQDLLDVKRAEGGKIALQLEPVVVQHALRDLLAALEPRLRAEKLTVQLLAPPADIIVHADWIRLRQIFSNLLDNAIKYTPREGRIWVKVNAEDKFAVIHVEDTGRGIPSDMLIGIFEQFTQVDAHTSTGLGVGLALVRELVLLHGGSVQAASKGIGQGSEFTVRLPLAALATAGAAD